MSTPNPNPTAAPAADPGRFSRPSRELKVLLMENIHENAVQVLEDAGFENIETHKTALAEDALRERTAVVASGGTDEFAHDRAGGSRGDLRAGVGGIEGGGVEVEMVRFEPEGDALGLAERDGGATEGLERVSRRERSGGVVRGGGAKGQAPVLERVEVGDKGGPLDAGMRAGEMHGGGGVAMEQAPRAG